MSRLAGQAQGGGDLLADRVLDPDRDLLVAVGVGIERLDLLNQCMPRPRRDIRVHRQGCLPRLGPLRHLEIDDGVLRRQRTGIDPREADHDVRIRPPRQQIRELIAHRPNNDRRTRLTVILERALRSEPTAIAVDIGDAFNSRTAIAFDAGTGIAGRIEIGEPRIIIEHFTDLDIRERAVHREPVDVETRLIEALRVARDSAFREVFRWLEHVFECTPKH